MQASVAVLLSGHSVFEQVTASQSRSLQGLPIRLACPLQSSFYRQSTPIALFTTKAPCAPRFSTEENRASFFWVRETGYGEQQRTKRVSLLWCRLRHRHAGRQ
jgi:hypothetical protein